MSSLLRNVNQALKILVLFGEFNMSLGAEMRTLQELVGFMSFTQNAVKKDDNLGKNNSVIILLMRRYGGVFSSPVK